MGQVRRWCGKNNMLAVSRDVLRCAKMQPVEAVGRGRWERWEKVVAGRSAVEDEWW